VRPNTSFERTGAVSNGRGAHYDEGHLNQLVEIRKWQEAGLSLERIRQIVKPDGETSLVPPPRPRQPGQVEVWSHLILDDGVELAVDPKRAGLSPEDVRALAEGVMGLYTRIRSKKE
jgi:DNA-binding transcriptional MerR regulator